MPEALVSPLIRKFDPALQNGQASCLDAEEPFLNRTILWMFLPKKATRLLSLFLALGAMVVNSMPTKYSGNGVYDLDHITLPRAITGAVPKNGMAISMGRLVSLASSVGDNILNPFVLILIIGFALGVPLKKANSPVLCFSMVALDCCTPTRNPLRLSFIFLAIFLSSL